MVVFARVGFGSGFRVFETCNVAQREMQLMMVPLLPASYKYMTSVLSDPFKIVHVYLFEIYPSFGRVFCPLLILDA